MAVAFHWLVPYHFVAVQRLLQISIYETTGLIYQGSRSSIKLVKLNDHLDQRNNTVGTI